MNTPTFVVGIRAPTLGCDGSVVAAVVEALIQSCMGLRLVSIKILVNSVELELVASEPRDPVQEKVLADLLADTVRKTMNVENIRVFGQVRR